MKENQIIKLEPKERVLAKARNYVESIELFLEESDQAIPLLLKALRYADRALKQNITFVLGFAKEETVFLKKPRRVFRNHFQRTLNLSIGSMPVTVRSRSSRTSSSRSLCSASHTEF
jgi:hypothetical protein